MIQQMLSPDHGSSGHARDKTSAQLLLLDKDEFFYLLVFAVKS
jgi:hypothetical protein